MLRGIYAAITAGVVCVAASSGVRFGHSEPSSLTCELDSPEHETCLLSRQRVALSARDAADATTNQPATSDDATTKKPTASDEASPNKASTPHLEKLGNSVWTITGKRPRMTLESNMERVSADIEMLWNTFFPKMEIPQRGASAILAVLLAVIWFAIYLNKIYTSDRSDRDWSKFKKSDAAEALGRINSSLVNHPDMILVIKAPEETETGSTNEAAEDSDSAEPAPQTRTRLVTKLSLDEDPGSPLSHGSARRVFGGTVGQQKASATTLFPRVTAHMEEKALAKRASAAVRMSALGDYYYRPYSKDSVRAKLLLDMQESLPQLGFDVHITQSADRQWCMVCVTLQKDDAIAKYLTLYNIKLQLQHKVIKDRLGIDQPVNEPESSPALIRFDRRIVEGLANTGVIDNNDPKELYRRYRSAGGTESIVTQSDRFRVMYKELTDHMDIEAAKEEGLLDDVFPAHDETGLWFLQSCWASWATLFDFTFAQPIHFLRGYFGSQLAFSFELVGFWSKMLCALVPLSVLYEIAVFVVALRDTDEADGGQTKQMLGFCIILVVWARLSANLWDREEAFLMQSWEVDAVDHLQVVRSKFQGEDLPSPVDANIMEKQYPAERAAMWRFLSHFITAVGCVIVTTFLFLERTVAGSNMYVSSIITVQMIICEFGYDYLAGILTDWENHKEHEDHYNSLLWKQSIFQSVNNYYPFMHLIVQQALHHNTGCAGYGGLSGQRGGNCLSLLRQQISLTLLFLSMIRVLQAQCACVGVRLALWWRRWRLERSENYVGAKHASFIERQIDFSPFYDRKQVWMLLYPVLSLGHVLLFSAAAPSVVFLCFIVFAVNLRASAFLIANYTKRPLPVDTRGIGEWRAVVHGLMKAGVVCTGFLLVTYGESFRNTPLITRVSGFMLFNFLAYTLNMIMEFIFPKEDSSAKLLAARRLHVERTVMRTFSGLRSRAGKESRAPPMRGVSFCT